jgi:hypothetical protein
LFKIEGDQKTGKIIVGLCRREDDIDPQNTWIENAIAEANTDDETKTEPY